MATASNRDVRLGFEIDVSNPEAVKRLADDVGRLADEGGAAAPEFQRLANDLDRLAAEAAALTALRTAADDVKRLADAQAAARGEAERLAASLKEQAGVAGQQAAEYARLRSQIAEYTRGLADTRVALKQQAVGFDEEGRAVAQSDQAKRELLATEQRLTLLRNGARESLSNLIPQLRENERAEAALARQHEASVRALDAADRALGQARGAYTAASDGAKAYGAALANLEAAQADAANRAKDTQALGQQVLAMDRAAQSAKQMADTLKSAFGTAGLRSLQDIAAETQRVDAAVTLLEAEFKKGAISAADFQRAVGGATVRLEQLRAEAANIPALPNAFERLNSTINTAISKFGSLTAAVATVGVALRPIIEAEVALQSVTRVLTQVTGSGAEAARQIEFLRNEAQRSGTSFTDTAAAYAKFAASTLQAGISAETTQRAFAAVSNAAGNLGLGSEQAKRALEALSQIASKGTVSMEELRQQLGDALPGVFPLLAKEMGVTTTELSKLVESGQLAASETIPALVGAIEKLGTEGGKPVQGLVAEWNRFTNAMKGAGTEILEGPIGTAAGVVLSGLSKVIVGIGGAAVAAAEGFNVVGKSIAALGAYSSGAIPSAKALSDELTRIGAEGQANVDRFIARYAQGGDAALKFGTASVQAGKASEQAAGAAAKHAEAVAGVGSAASGAAAPVQTVATSTTTLATASTAAVGAQKELGTAVAAAGTAAETGAKSYARLVLDTTASVDAAERATTAAKKRTEAAKDEADALIKAVSIAKDEVATAEAGVRASEIRTRAAQDYARAAADEVATLEKGLKAQTDYLVAQGRSAESIKESTKALRDKVQAAQSESDKAAQALKEIKAEADARKAAADALRDNSKRYEEFTKAVEDARRELTNVTRLYAEGKKSSDDLAEASTKLTVALARQRDALGDVARNAGLYVQQVKVANDLAAAGLSVRKAEADANLTVARALGDSRLAAEAEIDVKRIHAQEVQNAAAAKVSEANATISLLQAQRSATLGDDDAAAAKRREIDLRIQAEKVKIKEAEASKSVVRGLEAEIDALLRRNQAAASGIGGSENGIRSAGGQDNKLVADGGKNLSVLTPNNAPAVDNSFAFQVRDRLNSGGSFNANELAALQNGLATARNNAILAGESKIPSLNGQRDAEAWVRVFERAIERAAGPTLGTGFGPNTPNVTRPPIQLNLNVGGQTVQATTDSANADTLLAAIESAKKARGT